jgi:ribosomal protein S18 acetylase RimI-like enzyme
MQFSVRPAVREDGDMINELMSEESTYFRFLGVPDESLFNVESYLRDGFGPDPAFSGLVADTGIEILGYLLYHLGYDIDGAARNLNVMDLYVRSSSRRLGVGRALMEEAVNVCRRAGGSQVLWSVYSQNASAFTFYENLGANYYEDQRFMHLDV